MTLINSISHFNQYILHEIFFNSCFCLGCSIFKFNDYNQCKNIILYVQAVNYLNLNIQYYLEQLKEQKKINKRDQKDTIILDNCYTQLTGRAFSLLRERLRVSNFVQTSEDKTKTRMINFMAAQKHWLSQASIFILFHSSLANSSHGRLQYHLQSTILHSHLLTHY